MPQTPASFNPQLLKRSVRLAGHPTSISLEEAFWDILEAAAEADGVSLAQLLNQIDAERSGPLASAARVYAVQRLTEEVAHLRQRA